MTSMTVSAAGEVSADRLWTLLATPACWPAWAPHMRHVSRPAAAGAPAAVTVGQRLEIHTIAPLVRVPVEVTAVEEGVSWVMAAHLPLGTIHSGHRIAAPDDAAPDDAARDGAAEVTVTITWDGPALPGRVLLAAYRPVALLSVRRLLELAGSEQDGAKTAVQRLCL
ncbi:hypothetical protein [Euzebya tangerina]|uniref:hypothetical protein n=1 Tax=Euzebya tangerina TaxID=591198 RepID=UPI000E320C00|nr:hypothetical protein [Euzebya tangerina]